MLILSTTLVPFIPWTNIRVPSIPGTNALFISFLGLMPVSRTTVMTMGDQAAGGGDTGFEPVGFFLRRCRESYHYITGVAPSILHGA
jgi:hypothetical protein